MTDLLLVVFSFYASLFLRVNIDEAQYFIPALNKILPIVLVFRLLCFLYFETYNIIWRYVSAIDAFRLVKAISVSSVLIVATTYLFNLGAIPRSVYFIDAFLLVFMLAGIRIARRLFYEYQSSRQMQKYGARTLIYGAGVMGQGVLKRLLVDKDLKLFVVGFIDDDPKKIGKSISGFKVFGPGENLETFISAYAVTQVVVGVPDPSVDFLKDLLRVCANHGIKPLVLNQSVDTEIQTPLRQLELKDLLKRDPHEIDLTSTKEMISGKRVLITGAGGSIGSEITRQVLGFGPSRLMVLDHSEFNLYNIDQELKQSARYEETVVPCLVDIKDSDAVSNVFSQYAPEIVFHAAAYKHVHLVESNPHTSILNNVLGTKNLLDASEKTGVENFVLISTDKAVNPAGVMGSTKRICEVLTSLTGFRTNRRYCAVRFGNVLGSSGSLVPLLKKQIENGESLTITHKDITRYFMLIDEAVSLVLKAASFSKPGDINVLKMGEPVKIIDVAKTLITLMGKKEEDIGIHYTGLRPGEKMFEELYISGNELDTEHPDILVVPKGDALPANFREIDFMNEVEAMLEASRSGDKEAIFVLSKLVNSNYEHPTYEGQLKAIKLSKMTSDN
ncbi:polysaccharide biosynthesis protein [Bdellovibrio sp. HCB337]|uniref:polysaccharide biosynthesis protein n=1 Tax=Bdellovibrio sp. HCB337 TaxID=3394358 RepID=UPI0039A4E9A9